MSVAPRNNKQKVYSNGNIIYVIAQTKNNMFNKQRGRKNSVPLQVLPFLITQRIWGWRGESEYCGGAVVLLAAAYGVKYCI